MPDATQTAAAPAQATTYTVHLFPIVRVTRRGVEASSQQEAIKKAEEDTDLYALFPSTSLMEYAEDSDGYLVDEDADAEHEHSTWYDKDGQPRAPGQQEAKRLADASPRPPAGTKHYLIDFVYTENNQQFGTEADLTDAERDELETYLECHKGDAEIADAHIREAGAPVHQDFAKVKAEIKAAIGDNTLA